MLLTLVYATGIGGRIEGVWHYEWGNIFRPDAKMSKVTTLAAPVYFFATISSCWLFYIAIKDETLALKRRHMKYILASFLAVTVAVVKVMVVLGIDVPYVLPLGMILNDLFIALIGIAIIKHQLFDITVIVKKGLIYSGLAALIIFVFSFSEHMLANYIGHLLGHESALIHLVSIAVVIAVLMPVKHKLEHTVDDFFAQKKLEF